MINSLKKSLKLITAEKHCRYYMDKNLSDENLYLLRQYFYVDKHSLWYQPPEPPESLISFGALLSFDNQGVGGFPLRWGMLYLLFFHAAI